MMLDQLPDSLQKALVFTAKFGFIHKSHFFDYFTPVSLSYKYLMWNKFLESGFFRSYNRVGVALEFYSLTRKGVTFLIDNGVTPTVKGHPVYFEHDLIVAKFALANEKENLIHHHWQSEKVLKACKTNQIVDLFGASANKFPDLAFELSVPNKKIVGVLEVEKSRKSLHRYDSLVLSYSKLKNISLVIVAYSHDYTKDSIIKSARRLGYPQNQRPIVFCKNDELLKTPTSFKISIDGHKIEFNKYIRNIRILVEQSLENRLEIHSTNHSTKMQDSK